MEYSNLDEDIIQVSHNGRSELFRNPSKSSEGFIEPLNLVIKRLTEAQQEELYKHVTQVSSVEEVVNNIQYFSSNEPLLKAIYDVCNNELPHPDLPETFVAEDNPAGYTPTKTWTKSEYPETLKEILISKFCLMNSMSLKSLIRVKRTLLNTLMSSSLFDSLGWKKIYEYITESTSSADFISAALQQGLSQKQLRMEICWNVFQASMPRLSVYIEKGDHHHVVHQIINYIKSNLNSRSISIRNVNESTPEGVDLIAVDVTTRDLAATAAMVLDTELDELVRIQELTDAEIERTKQLVRILLSSKPHVSPINELLVDLVIKSTVHFVDLPYENIINLISTTRVILERHLNDKVLGPIMPQLIALSTSGITASGKGLNNLGNNNTALLNELNPGLSSLEFNTEPAFKKVFEQLTDNLVVDNITGETVNVYNVKVNLVQLMVNLDIIYGAHNNENA